MLLHVASKLLQHTLYTQVDVALRHRLARLSGWLVLQDKAAGGMGDGLEDSCGDDGEKEERQEKARCAVCRFWPACQKGQAIT